MPNGTGRRTLKLIDRYPTPREIFDAIKYNQWPYKSSNRNFLTARDRALCALLYIVALRRSEANRLTRNQFTIEENQITIQGIKLSKAERHNQKTGKTIMRKELFRKEAWIPLRGQREQLGRLIQDYIELLDKDAKLFDFAIGSTRIWQIVECYTRGLAGKNRGITPHWLRAYGENYLYDNWDKDILAVASYVSVDARTLSLYIKKGYAKYQGRNT